MLTVSSVNVNGIRAAAKKGFREWLTTTAADVVCLQEIKATPQQVPGDLFVAATYHAHWHGHGGYSATTTPGP